MNQPVDPELSAALGGEPAAADVPPRSIVALRHRLRHAWPGVACWPTKRPPTPAAIPLRPRPAHFPAKAKRVIFLFMSGGPSHVDLFDPKPRLAAGQRQAAALRQCRKLERTKTGNLLGSPFKFEKHGQSGIEVSELFPNVGRCIDDLCVIRSMVADNINHNGACLQMNTGEQAFSRPSLGSWLTLRPGQREPEPARLRRDQPRASRPRGAPLWSSSFLPAAYQGTLVVGSQEPDRQS